MDPRTVIKIGLLISMQLLCLRAKAESGRSVLFFDTPTQRYIRNRPLDAAGERKLLSGDEVAAAVSVLLGFAPASLLSSESSSKLNEVLLPNPFNQPHAVFVLEVQGVEGPLLLSEHKNSHMANAFSSKLLGSSKVEIQLPGEDEVSVTDLDEPLGIDCDAVCIDKELDDLAHVLGGSYVGTLESLDGELSIPLSSGTSIKLHVAKSADWEFAVGLVTLVRRIKKAVEIHEDFAGSSANTAELMIGHFRGIKVLEEEYGSGDIVHRGAELFQTTVSRLFDSLQMSFGGKIVGVILSSKETHVESEAMLEATFSSPASRLLEEVDGAKSAEVLLVRRSLAWITGVILLVSTLIGIYFLLNMPLTRDTLLYSNVKLD